MAAYEFDNRHTSADGGAQEKIKAAFKAGGADGCGPAFTEKIADATGPNASERLRTVFADLVRHLHDFCRDNQITTEEWLAALEFGKVNEAGRMSDARRNEGQLLCGVLGIETLLDRMQDAIATADLGSSPDRPPTASNLLGPFYQHDSPVLDNGASIVLDDSHKGRMVHMSGRVLDAVTEEPLCGVELDIWHSNAEGLYAQQDPAQPYNNLRGRFFSDDHGRYDLYCGIPAKYSIPADGPAGKLLRLLDRHTMRPAHLHFILRAKGYDIVTTELFDRQSQFLEEDSMFAVKESLIVDFVPIEGNDKADYELVFDFRMRRLLTET